MSVVVDRGDLRIATPLEGTWEYGLVEGLVDDGPAQNIRVLLGPHYSAFADICKELTTSVVDIVPNATEIDFHHPSRYVSEAEIDARRAAYREAGTGTHYLIDQQLKAYRQRLAKYGVDVAWSREGCETMLPAETLDQPRYVRQYGGMACTAACVSMLFQEITGERLDDWKFEKSMSDRMGIAAYYDEYAKLFDGDLFRELFDVEVTQLEITGASLSLIRRIAEKARMRLPGARIFCTLPLQSDAFADTWHHAVLLHDEEASVTILDPKADLQPGGLQMRKGEFYRRWAVGFFRAHVYVATPTSDHSASLGATRSG